MDENVKCIEPNMAIYFRDLELKHYNLVWGQWQYNSQTPSYVTYITNMLLQKGADGEFIPPAYPTAIELQTQVDSLDYDGEFFWSVQALNDTPHYPGWIISKWYISDDIYGLDRAQFKSFPGFVKANCLSAEWYRFTLRGGTDPTKDYITVNTSYDYVMDRIEPGFVLKIGPNNQDDVFWGTVRKVEPYPNNPYYSPYWYNIYFEENLNSSYVAGEDVFVNAGIFVFDSGGTLNRLHPVDLSVMEQWTGGQYTNVNGCAFTVVNNVPSINVGMKTPALFFVRDMMVYCKAVANMEHTISAQILEKQFNMYGNSFIQVQELRIRNDHPDEITNYPQHYLLQKEYRDDRDIDSRPSEWSTYNYVLQKLHAQPAIMQVDVQPQFVTQSGIAECSCRILDDYGFPVEGITVIWSNNCGAKAHFLATTSGTTDAEGYIYNQLYADENLDFPAYVTATTDEL